MRTGTRGKALGAFGVVGAGLMLSSTAYACTIYMGKMTASGNGAGNVSQTVVGKGTGLAGAGMDWCGGHPTPSVKVASGSASISLDTSPAPKNRSCKASQMRDSTVNSFAYDVGVTAPGVGYMPQGGGGTGVHNCHQPTGSTTVTVVDTGEVNAAGVFTSATTGTSTVNYATAGVGPNSICIFYQDGPDAIAINMDTV